MTDPLASRCRPPCGPCCEQHFHCYIEAHIQGVTCDNETPDGPSCCELACYEDEDCACDGCRENPDETVSVPDATRLRKAAKAVVDAWGRYIEAHAGRLHDGPHEIVPVIDDERCGQCIADQYGTEVEMSEYAIPTLRDALGEEDPD